MTKKVQIYNGFVYTTAIRKLKNLRKRTKVIPGGTSAGKTFGVIPILIDRATKTPALEISIVSESIPHLRKGAMKDFLKIMRATGRYIDKNWNKTHLTYTFSNGSFIEFFSADQEERVRGPRRHILYVNEGNNIKKFDTFYQLAIRTSVEIWLDFNPSHEFWAHTELQEDEDVEWIVLTYKDNEGLPESIVKEIEKAKAKAFHDPELKPDVFVESNIKSGFWANWWKVYGLGLLGSLDGVILNNWTLIDSVPKEAEYLGSGLDFGYTNDPSTIIDIYKWNGKRIVDEVLYAKGQDNDMLADAIEERSVFADSAEPKSIDYIKLKKKKNIKGVVKGADSIVFGLELMQMQEYLITKRSVNLIREVRKYSYDKDKTGKKSNKPAEGQEDHAIDGWRYAEMSLLARTERVVDFGWD